jgi:hypothetical protein
MPPTPVVIPIPMHPFKIYQPTKYVTNLGSIIRPATGLVFDSAGALTQCAINSAVPTNLPTTVNPTTDGWRLWAVRNGRVEIRPYYSQATNPANDINHSMVNNYSQNIDIFVQSLSDPAHSSSWNTRRSGTDGVCPDLYQLLTYQDTTTEIQPFGDVLVLTGSESSSRQYLFYIEITPDTPTTLQVSKIKYFVPDASVNGGAWMPAFSPLVIPIGILTFESGSTTSIVQLLQDHCLNRYPVGMYSKIQLVAKQSIPSGCIYRGCWQTDADLVNQYFYPGDVIYWNPGTSTTITKSGVSLKLFKSAYYMAVKNSKTSDPSTDSTNFMKVSESISDVTFP